MSLPQFHIDAPKLAKCEKYARLMCQGAKTRNFKHGTLQGEEVYLTGKIGEAAAWLWFKQLDVRMIWTPFRQSYQYFHPDDDFIVEVAGRRKQIEVRTKARNVEPMPDFECCSDSIKPHLTYLFISYNRKTSMATVVGWANETLMRSKVRAVLRGEGNCNFKHKANEFNIRIEDLYEPDWFVPNLCSQPSYRSEVTSKGEYVW